MANVWRGVVVYILYINAMRCYSVISNWTRN
jgi:hypothetical protein